MGKIYNTVWSKNFNSDPLIIPVYGSGDDGYFGFRTCVETYADPTISAGEVYSAQPVNIRSVFTHSDGKNYLITNDLLYQKNYWCVSNGSFLLLGIQHDHYLLYDFNRECEWVSPTFNRVYQWCNSKAFRPIMAVFVNDKTQPIENFSRVFTISGVSGITIENPELDFGERIESWNVVYLPESISVKSAKLVENERVEVTFNNAPDGDIKIYPRGGMLCNKVIHVQNQIGYVDYFPEFLNDTSFDIKIDDRLIKTISLSDLTTED